MRFERWLFLTVSGMHALSAFFYGASFCLGPSVAVAGACLGNVSAAWWALMLWGRSKP